MDKIEMFEGKIGYSFKDKSLLKKALTHTSYANEKNVDSNEKFEFLGDSILEFITSKYIYKNYSDLSEGEMTKVRAAVVCEESLFKIAKKHDFSDFLYLGKSEAFHKGNKAILADSVEALIAAIFFDAGIEEAEKFIVNNLKEEIEIASKNVGKKDYKTVLQEILQVNGNIEIKYNIIKEEGPDHNKVFTSEVIVAGKRMACGVGKSKKLAEMEAAKKAIEIIEGGES